MDSDAPPRTKRLITHWYGSRLFLFLLLTGSVLLVKRLWFTSKDSASSSTSAGMLAERCQSRHSGDTHTACADWADRLLGNDPDIVHSIEMAQTAYSLAYQQCSMCSESDQYHALATVALFRQEQGNGIPLAVWRLEEICSGDDRVPSESRRGFACYKLGQYLDQVPSTASAALVKFKQYTMGYYALGCQLGMKEACKGARPPVAPKEEVPCVSEAGYAMSCSR